VVLPQNVQVRRDEKASVTKVLPPPVSSRKSPGTPFTVTCTVHSAFRKRSSLITCGASSG
jgi:hypothetical protein